ncbi:hypothetical protein [Spiroplasma endosymbiont of Labia minor]|uniref:hypothetical protein n=1 Tax=Spiroplasma endosymbiont of Labia minor TaxID=3066305 RepID=UPI0030D0B7DA
MSNYTMPIVIALVIVVVLVFMIVSTITRKKADKKERKERKRIVKNEIKRYIAQTELKKNISVDFEKVFARKGEAYKYRDVFDVVVSIRNPKSNEVLEQRAYEVEGVTRKIDKKNYKTDWKVNGRVNLEETNKKIAIAEKRIKLSKDEKKKLREDEKLIVKQEREKQKAEYKAMKEKRLADAKAGIKPVKNNNEISDEIKRTTTKYIPQRKK